MKIDYILYKTIGFFNYTNSDLKEIRKGLSQYSLSEENSKFLNQSYHSEYLKIMFSHNNVERLYKDFDYEVKIVSIDTNVNLNKLELFLFNEDYTKNQLAVFSLSYSINNKTIDDTSNITNALNRYNTEITYQEKTYLLKEFIAEILLNNKKFYEENSPAEQYAGSRLKNYLILDLNHEKSERDSLLYEIGTCSKIGTIKRNDLNSPSISYQNKILENKIACFNNYEGLALLDSFTVIGTNNYSSENIFSHKTWDDIYFTIYIFNLYMKCSLQILSNDFSSNPMKKRKVFQKFYNKYFFNKISFNFLPNEMHKGINNGLEIQDDINFISDRLETLATQVNEIQQKQQESLLLVISVIALLETPLHLDGIREIIGIKNEIIYNSAVYALLLVTVISFLVIKIRRNR
jgi:hypothetical protein